MSLAVVSSPQPLRRRKFPEEPSPPAAPETPQSGTADVLRLAGGVCMALGVLCGFVALASLLSGERRDTLPVITTAAVGGITAGLLVFAAGTLLRHVVEIAHWTRKAAERDEGGRSHRDHI